MSFNVISIGFHHFSAISRYLKVQARLTQFKTPVPTPGGAPCAPWPRRAPCACAHTSRPSPDPLLSPELWRLCPPTRTKLGAERASVLVRAAGGHLQAATEALQRVSGDLLSRGTMLGSQEALQRHCPRAVRSGQPSSLPPGPGPPLLSAMTVGASRRADGPPALQFCHVLKLPGARVSLSNMSFTNICCGCLKIYTYF